MQFQQKATLDHPSGPGRGQRAAAGEAGELTIPADFARQIGLGRSMTYLEAYEWLQAHGSRRRASTFVAAVLALRGDERVQGRELG